MTKQEMLEKVRSIIRESMEREEGVRYVTYRDTEGHLTGGIGHLITKKDGYTKVGQVIPQETVEKWFWSDITIAIKAAIDQAEELGEYEVDFIIALTHVNFQLGVHWPSEWPNTYKKLKNGELRSAIRVFQGSLWNRQTPRRVKNFIAALEQEIVENNQFEFKPTVAVATTKQENEMDNDIKPGYKTTEFWAGVVTSIGVTLNQSGILGSIKLPTEALATIATIVAGYIISRGLAKLNAE